MKKTEKKMLLKTMLVICMLVGGLLVSSNTIYASGTSGVDGEIKWEVVGDTLTLSAVEGTQGRMKDYSFEVDAAWSEAAASDTVKNIIIDETVTKLGEMAFKEGAAFEKVEIAGSIKTIPSSFWRGVTIRKLILHEGVETIESFAFFCVVQTAEFPKSTKNIDIKAIFCSGDGICNFLQKVYGYEGSGAEVYVDAYNEKVRLSREADKTGDYKLLDGYFGVDYDYDGGYDSEGFMEFIALDDGTKPETENKPTPETPSYELQINQNYTDSNLGNYDVAGNTGDITYKSNNDELKKVLAYFTAEYSAAKLIPLDISLSENGIMVSVKECTIKIPIPAAWDNHKESIKVLTITDGQIEVVSSKIVLEESSYYISFVPPHFSPYALYLDYDESENNTGGSQTPSTNNGGTDTGSGDKELDDTPKTGIEFDPMVVAIICLVLVGAGLLILPRKEF